jgi:hypothetical protein
MEKRLQAVYKSLDEVRRALSTISGSLSEAVIALRQER